MRISVLLGGLLICVSAQAAEVNLQRADAIARESAAWFEYTTGRIESETQGQCGDYAVMFILKYNAAVGMIVARLVTANNLIPSGTRWPAKIAGLFFLAAKPVNFNASGAI